ncbi:iron-containing redox enzyme family protein [uncultured Nocardioides sp.]|uniref:iron-containing redox enzyme family protein n=1 Tax=uncultured Nocardioides sp. TaxID=198441 RepID=UPI0025F27B56|nr:iron-containing redox enzyme family protein [uncultured Nocardioides sp.]
MILPKPRGELSAALFEALRSVPERTPPLPQFADDAADAALSLWVLHELSYRGFEDVDDEAEWDLVALGVRRTLERELEQRLRDRWPGNPAGGYDPDELLAFVEADDGPSLSSYIQKKATREETLELLRQRSVYHLKEADPSAWTVPRLPVRAQAALVELQFDEYGDGDPNRLHSHLFARGLDAEGLRSERGAYIDEATPETLEMNNAMSLFGLHRRLRGAAMGHLAAFEASSSLPSRKMAQGLERLGFNDQLVGYYTEHVEADAVHEQLAARDICGTLAEDDPGQADGIWFGAFTCLDLEARFARSMFERWGSQE